eukprot:m.159079 g.159079  ORF g.159079 m.159079 type:complete len:414 (+) comp17991_c0_seq3:360-1601(+)
MAYIKVVKVDSSKSTEEQEIVEVPTEDESTLLLTTLASQFEDAIGLKYKNPETHAMRALKVKDGNLYAPADGWGDHTYLVVLQESKPRNNKRTSGAAELDGSSADTSNHALPTPAAAAATQQAAAQAPVGAFTSPTVPTGLRSDTAPRLFIGNLPFSIQTPDRLYDLFPGATNITIPTHQDSGKIKGFGYIVYPTLEQATQALNEKNGLEIDGRKTFLDYAPYGGGPASKKIRSDRCKRVWVGNLPFSITSSHDLYQYFEGATHITVPTHADTGKIKGFGYIEFPTPEAAEACLNSKANLEIDGRRVRLDFAPMGGGPAPRGGRHMPPPHFAQQGGFGGGLGGQQFGYQQHNAYGSQGFGQQGGAYGQQGGAYGQPQGGAYGQPPNQFGGPVGGGQGHAYGAVGGFQGQPPHF